MKLSYKTNIWPGLTWGEHKELAGKMELDGLELCYSPAESSGLMRDMQLRQQFLRSLSEKQLVIACIAVDIGSASLGFSESAEYDFDTARKNATDCIELARALRTPYVCLDMGFETNADEAFLVSLIGVILPKAESEGITLLV